MTDVSALRLRLSAGVVCLPSRSGASCRSHGTTLDIDEPGTYELMRRLARDLDGIASVADIIERYEPHLRPAVVRLVCRLLEEGIVRGAPVRRTTRLPDLVRARFAAPLALLHHLSDDAEERFERFRTSRVLMLGSGTAFGHCAAALLRNGVEQLWVLERAGLARSPATVEAEAEAANLRRVGLAAAVHAIPEADLWSRQLEPFSLVLYAADSASLRELSFVGRHALRHGCDLLAGFLLEHRIVLGPLMRMPACYVCTLLRTLRDVCDASQLRQLFQRIGTHGGVMGPPSPAADALARRLGSDVAFEAFKALAGGVRPELTRGLIVQTATAPDSVRAGFVPCVLHSCWGVCRRFQPPPATIAC